MDLHFSFSSHLIISFSITLFTLSAGVLGATFTFVNKCDYKVWPGILANAGSPTLDTTGFELPRGSSRSYQAPTGWSGRFWGRTGCKFDGSGSGSCATGDCGSGQVECNGAGAAPPATLAEFTLGTVGQDFYDVSLVDGYNLPMLVEANGGSGTCASTGCVTDLNQQCPKELRAGDGRACKSACEAFGSPEYCCSGAYNTPAVCKPSVYSQMFKSACPRSYSYAYDDPTSTFTCGGADYTVTFCPSMPSQKSTRDSSSSSPSTTSTPPPTTIPAPAGGSGPGTMGYGSDSGTLGSDSGTIVYGSDSGTLGSGSGTMVYGTESGNVDSGTESLGSGSGSEAMLADRTWLAGLAMGDSTRTLSPSASRSAIVASATVSFVLSFLYL